MSDGAMLRFRAILVWKNKGGLKRSQSFPSRIARRPILHMFHVFCQPHAQLCSL